MPEGQTDEGMLDSPKAIEKRRCEPSPHPTSLRSATFYPPGTMAPRGKVMAIFITSEVYHVIP